ncbi:MAG: hypothetical protein MK077_00595 [Phycisphaerales bacterium]|nr:hypothetical protein [Phycisphaerales bacterium]
MSACSTVLSILMLAGIAAPGDSASEYRIAGIEPVVTPYHFRNLMDQLGLSEQDSDTAAVLMDDYAQDMRQVLVELASQRDSDRERLDAAIDGRIRVSPEELRSIRISMRTAVVPSWDVADGKLADLVEWATLISPLPASTQQTAVGDFYRQVFLRESSRDGMVDLHRLLDRALAEELTGMTREEIAPALFAWTREASLFAKRDAWTVRQHRLDDDLAALRNQPEVRITLQQEAAHGWLRRIAILDDGAQAVAVVVETKLGPGPAAAWKRRVRGACFPNVSGRIDAEVASQWVMRNGDTSQQQAALDCLAQQAANLEALRAEATNLLRQGRAIGIDLAHESASKVSDATSLRMKFLRNSGERSVLIQEMLDCVQGSLSEGQRAAIRRVLITGG